MRALIILVVIVAAVSCRPLPTITNTEKDSVTIVERIRFDTVRIQGERVVLSVPIECDTLTGLPKPLEIRKIGRKSSAGAAIDKAGRLTVDCKTDSLIELVQVKDREISRLSSRLKTVVEPPEFVTRPIDKFCRFFTALFFCAAIAIAFLKYKRVI